MRDDRIGRIATAQRTVYRERLRNGHGYDAAHRTLLAELQAEQARCRNVDDGYWIAEAEPDAADHALTATVSGIPWAVLATDGAYRPMRQNQWDDWARIALDHSVPGMAAILERCHRAEAMDPDGLAEPRAKRHDDKTLVSVRF